MSTFSFTYRPSVDPSWLSNSASAVQTMPTRAATAREVAFLTESTLLNTSDEPERTKVDAGPRPEKATLPKPGVRKRKRDVAKITDPNVVNGELVTGGWDKLPHNMGTAINTTPVRTAADALVKVESGVEEPLGRSTRLRSFRGSNKTAASNVSDVESFIKNDPLTEELVEATKQEAGEQTPNPSQRKSNGRKIPKVEAGDDKMETTPKKKRASRAKKVSTSNDVQAKVDDLLEAAEAPVKKPKKGKKNPYGLSPGETPFPDFSMPTVEACKEVNSLLSELHGHVEAPKEIPAPSLEVTGCGEVPSVLDALVRTRLSAATTGQNARYAFQGLVERYGLYDDGIGKGSVNWNKVRDSSESEIAEAIKRGGLAVTKSKSIKAILDMVYAQNVSRRDAFIAEKEHGVVPDVIGAAKQIQGQKDMEIAVANQNVLSLQYMHGLTSEEALSEFVKFPGIGVKTASCVILFCLQRPSFAVDTHVWRLCKWLKWVPEGATRDQTFSHCEVRIPNDMKYSLHQLFIKHGKTCGRCRAITGESSEVWADTKCPIEQLVVRTGVRKGGSGDSPVKKSGRRVHKKGKKPDKWDSESEELSDIPSEATEDEED